MKIKPPFPQPQLSGRLYLASLAKPITVERDRWGVTYIFAKTRADLFFGQGFVHAQDRLWQMELNRRAANGTLSALFGKRTLPTDRLSRTLGFARLAKAAWGCLSEQAQADLLAYTAGLNAYLDSQPKRPFEFLLLNHHAGPWQPLDSLAYGRLQMWALTTGASSELIYAQLIEAVGADKASELAMHYPAENPITLPNGIERNNMTLDGMLKTAVSPFLGKGAGDGAGRGSNGWVVSPSRSQSDHAILANDMHLPVGTPSLWHLQHLESDSGFKAAGFTQPGLPYIMIGHNEQIAWGATMAYTDGEDLFLEQFDTKRPLHYLHNEEWLEAEQIEEIIPIRHSKPHKEAVVYTKHGPLIDSTLCQPHSQQYRIALASVALNPALTMDGFGLLNSAHNWATFETAVSRIQAPNLNLLYADRTGTIGHYLTGQVPIRLMGDGAQPRLGWEEKYNWQGVIPFSQMPHAVNPAKGFIVSANQKIVPESYPHYLGKMWRNGYRANRIETLLEGITAVSPQDCLPIQQDVFSQPAQQLCRKLETFTFSQPNAQFCLETLKAWQHDMLPTHIAPTIFQVFVAKLTHNFLRDLPLPLVNSLLGEGVHPNLQPVNDFQGQWLVSLLAILDNPNSSWLSVAQKETLLKQSLVDTAVLLQHQFDIDPQTWAWGNHHTVTFKHALSEQSPLDKLFDVGPFPMGGDGSTVLQTSMQPATANSFDFCNNGISVSTRMIADLSDWNQFQVIHAPGQSGHVGHSHYADLAPLWANGRLIKIPWQKDKIAHASLNKLLLLPQKEKIE